MSEIRKTFKKVIIEAICDACGIMESSEAVDTVDITAARSVLKKAGWSAKGGHFHLCPKCNPLKSGFLRKQKDRRGYEYWEGGLGPVRMVRFVRTHGNAKAKKMCENFRKRIVEQSNKEQK